MTLPLTAGLYGLYGQLVFGANQLDQSGFTNITLKSVNDITMEGGLALGPSLVKLAQPVPGGGSQDVIPGLFSLTTSAPTTILATQDEIAASSVTLAAGITGSGMTGGVANPYGNFLLLPGRQQRTPAPIFLSVQGRPSRPHRQARSP